VMERSSLPSRLATVCRNGRTTSGSWSAMNSTTVLSACAIGFIPSSSQACLVHELDGGDDVGLGISVTPAEARALGGGADVEQVGAFLPPRRHHEGVDGRLVDAAVGPLAHVPAVAGAVHAASEVLEGGAVGPVHVHVGP